MSYSHKAWKTLSHDLSSSHIPNFEIIEFFINVLSTKVKVYAKSISIYRRISIYCVVLPDMVINNYWMEF